MRPPVERTNALFCFLFFSLLHALEGVAQTHTERRQKLRIIRAAILEQPPHQIDTVLFVVPIKSFFYNCQ